MPKILIVDDETPVRELLYDLVTGQGHDVFTAGSGTQAIEALRAQRPQLLLLDARMPTLSGLQTAEKIRAFDDTVLIALLQAPDDAEVSAAERRRLGIAEVIRKDPDRGKLSAALDGALKRLLSRAGPPASGAKAMGIRGSLLVIDDDPHVRALVQAFFEPRGFRVLQAASGEEGLTALAAQQPHAVMLDMNMTGMDGLMTLRKIKATHPALPVIMATGVDEDAIVKEALSAGAYDYVVKPFNLEYLETVVLTKLLLGIEG